MSEQSNQEVVALIKRMQDQLSSLERKVDVLLNKSQEKPFNRDRNFSKPHKSFGGHAPRHEKGGTEKWQSEEKRGFTPKFVPKNKKFFNKTASSR